MSEQTGGETFDLLVIGGGVNGCGIARDAAGRGLTVALVEQGDLAQATSSASTKLFHGGLRYLEYYEFRLVREALKEREVLLAAMPHIAWPMRFVLPHHRGLRPAWFLRLGLFIYDHLGGRKMLPPTRTLDLRTDALGKPLKPEFVKGFEYSDCWVDDARLVVLNARDAAKRGAVIKTRTRCESAERRDGIWHVGVSDQRSGAQVTLKCRALVNAGGPWVVEILNTRMRLNTPDKIRLVRGSHVVVRRLFNHDRAYIFQQSDGRIVFAIPYEGEFTLIGTTDIDHDGEPDRPECTPEEAAYLCEAVSDYFREPVTIDDIVWTYSGVRPLYDDGASSATAATRDYVLKVETDAGAVPLLNIFGGKITTYRRLAEAAVDRLVPFFSRSNPAWTVNVPLPGGDFPVESFDALVAELQTRYPFLDPAWATRLARAYGTEASAVLGDASSQEDLGLSFGGTLTEREVNWLQENEWAETADDVLWRRSKLGLKLANIEETHLKNWMQMPVRKSSVVAGISRAAPQQH